MKLTKRLLAGSMILMLSFSNMHAEKGGKIAPAAPQRPTSGHPYEFRVPVILSATPSSVFRHPSLRNVYNNPYGNIVDFEDNILIRECNTSEFVRNFNKKIVTSLENLRNGDLSLQEKSIILFLEDMLKVNGIFDERTLRKNSLENLIQIDTDVPQGNLCIVTRKGYPFNAQFGHQLFLFPFEPGTLKICVNALKDMLTHLVDTLGTLTIRTRSSYIHLKEINRESGVCKIVVKDKIITRSITELAHDLYDRNSQCLDVYFLDKLPKKDYTFIEYYTRGEEVSSFIFADGQKNNSSDEENSSSGDEFSTYSESDTDNQDESKNEDKHNSNEGYNSENEDSDSTTTESEEK